ncbi:MAG: hypothetical protein ACK4I8_01200 [Armatimonadota bacterium]
MSQFVFHTIFRLLRRAAFRSDIFSFFGGSGEPSSDAPICFWLLRRVAFQLAINDHRGQSPDAIKD